MEKKERRNELAKQNSYREKIQTQLNEIKNTTGYSKFEASNPILEKGKIMLREVGYNI